MTTTAPAATTEPVLTLLPDTCPRSVTTTTESPRLPQLERDRTSESACPRACPSPTRGDQHQDSPLRGPPDAHVMGERRALISWSSESRQPGPEALSPVFSVLSRAGSSQDPDSSHLASLRGSPGVLAGSTVSLQEPPGAAGLPAGPQGHRALGRESECSYFHLEGTHESHKLTRYRPPQNAMLA